MSPSIPPGKSSPLMKISSGIAGGGGVLEAVVTLEVGLAVVGLEVVGDSSGTCAK